MRKLEASDLMGLEAYHKSRLAFREKVMAHKRDRQVAVGPNATLYFEDWLTIQYQVQEMLRIERIFESEAIDDELQAYVPLIPDGSNLKATFMVEFADPEERRRELGRLVGIEDKGLAKEICSAQAWQSVVPFTEPTEVPSKIPDTAPDVHLNLEWVHGFNSKQSRQTVTYTGKGHIVYPAGALGVVYNIELKEQLYMNAHTDVILCMRTHVLPNKQTLCASGEAGKLPRC